MANQHPQQQSPQPHFSSRGLVPGFSAFHTKAYANPFILTGFNLPQFPNGYWDCFHPLIFNGAFVFLPQFKQWDVGAPLTPSPPSTPTSSPPVSHKLSPSPSPSGTITLQCYHNQHVHANWEDDGASCFESVGSDCSLLTPITCDGTKCAVDGSERMWNPAGSDSVISSDCDSFLTRGFFGVAPRSEKPPLALCTFVKMPASSKVRSWLVDEVDQPAPCDMVHNGGTHDSRSSIPTASRKRASDEYPACEFPDTKRARSI